TVEMVTQLPALKPRPADSNKGTFGRVLVIAGSRGMAGGAVLCASAALRGGAGLVRLSLARQILPAVAAAHPSHLTAPLAQDDNGLLATEADADLLALAQANDVVAFGPGLGRSTAITMLLSRLVAHTTMPLVIDADGLNALAGHTTMLAGRQGPVIL